MPRLPAGLLDQALAAARQMTTEDGRAPVLTALASRLPDARRQQVWTQALTATHMTRDYLIAPLQSALAESLPAGLSAGQLTEALTAARQVIDEEQRAPLLAGLAQQLPSSQQQVMAEALAAAAQISRYGGARRKVLAEMARPLADLLPGQACRMWRDILPLLARWTAPASLEAATSVNCPLSYRTPAPYSGFPRTLSAAYPRSMSEAYPHCTKTPSPSWRSSHHQHPPTPS